jgi:hypothetical protein
MWGRYDYADVDTTKPAKCKMTPASGAPYEVNILHRDDGVWSGVFSGLDARPGYKADAYYTKKSDGTQVPATQETGIEVTSDPLLIPFPPPYPAPIPIEFTIARSSTFSVPGGVNPPTPPRVQHGIYPVCTKFQRMLAIVHQKADAMRYASVNRVLAELGKWTVIIPGPADIASVEYFVEMVMLDREGRLVAPPSFFKL